MADTQDELVQQHYSRILGFLIRLTGSFEDAEDICQDVMLTALTHWQRDGPPAKPLAWLYTTARNRVIDRYRTERQREDIDDHEPIDKQDVLEKLLEDDLLRLIFTCCHPALSEDVRVPLTLKSITGLSLQEVARAFLVSPSAMEQRLLRAKRKIARAGIAYEIPSGHQLDERLDSVLQTIYLLFNEGYTATSGESLLKPRLCEEAIRLATLMQRLFPGRAEVMSLLALLLIQHSRQTARIDADGDLVLLPDQDRSLWDKRAIQQATALLDKALHMRQRPGRYQLLASIAALHAEAPSPADTDWHQITALYRRLLDIDYSHVLHLNHAVALGMSGNLEASLVEMDELAPLLKNYFPFYCARADATNRLNLVERSRTDFERALSLAGNDSERRFVEAKLKDLDQREHTER